MEKLLTEFAHYLRNQGVSLPTSSLEEALKLLPYIRLQSRFDFEISLMQLFIKQQEQRELYHLCFHEFFYEKIHDIIHNIEKRKTDEQIKQLKNEFYQKLESKKGKNERDEGDREQERKEENWQDFLKISTPAMEGKSAAPIHEHLKEFGSLLGTDEAIEKLNAIKPKEMEEYIEELIWQAIEKDQPSFIFDSINGLQKELTKTRNEVLKFKNKELTLLNNVVKKEHSGMRKMVQTQIDQLQEKEIKKLNKEELEEVREHIREHSKALFTKFSKLLRQTTMEKEIDMVATIQNSVRTYGVPMELFYVKPKKNKTNIQVVLDVSGSVVKSAELMLMFMYLLYQHFPNQVRAFTFVGLLTEVTDELKNENWEDMLHWCLKKAPIDYRGYSDYNRAFSVYEKTALEDVSEDTIVIIVGDARNNKNSARIPTFKTLKEKAKAVYWLNPEPKEKWNEGDSVIGKYEEYANRVFEVIRTKDLLKSLEGISQDLVLS